MAEQDDPLQLRSFEKKNDSRIFYDGNPIMIDGVECHFYKNHDTDTIWWVSSPMIGSLMFSFNRITVFNLWSDYPFNLTSKQKEIFDRENPYWADFFKNRV